MKNGLKPDSRLVHAGRRSELYHGIVNPPVFHASTVLFPTLDALEGASPDAHGSCYYGRFGTPTRFLLEEAIGELAGGYATLAVSSGYGAVTQSLLAFLSPGDHVLITDSAYMPTRAFADRFLIPWGVEVDFYDPAAGAGIAAAIRSNTRVVFTESPGSLTFEMQDIPAIAAAAHAAGAKVLLDNTWAGPTLCRPFEMGVDVSIQAATKYIAGHADVMMGAISCATEADFLKVRKSIALMGDAVGPDDAYLALRGLRTLSVRLARHHETAIALADWLKDRAEVARVLHPALPEDPGHAIWKRDFSGASGLFGFVLEPGPRAALAAMLDGMRLFGMGYSWGGFESLLLPAHPRETRTATRWRDKGQLIRIHAGLEDVTDLIADLEDGLTRFGAAR